MKSHPCSGQSLLFGAFAMLILVPVVALPLHTGRITQQKIQLQQAADQAVAAGAVVQANIASAVAYLNNSQTLLHALCAREHANLAVWTTAAMMSQRAVLASTSAMPADYFNSFDVESMFQDALLSAQQNIGTYRALQDHVEHLSWGLLKLGPDLINREMYRVALHNLGVDGEEDPEGLIRMAALPERLEMDTGSEFSRDFDINTAENFFDIHELTTDQRVTITTLQENTQWDMHFFDGGADRSLLYTTDGQIPPEELHVVTEDGSTGVHFIYNPTLPGWEEQMSGLRIGEGEHGGTYVYVPNQLDGEYRRDPEDNSIQVWENGDWEEAGVEEVEVGGVQVQVGQSLSVGLDIWGDSNPDAWINFLNQGFNFSMVFQNDMSINVHLTPHGIQWNGVIAGVAYSVDNQNQLVINGRSMDEADGVWHGFTDIRDRLTKNPEDTTPIPHGNYWYSIRAIGPLFVNESNGHRFGFQQSALKWLATDATPSTLPSWVSQDEAMVLGADQGWFDMSRGFPSAQGAGLNDHRVYHQTRACWHDEDLWCPYHDGPSPGPGSVGSEPRDGGWHVDVAGEEVWVSCDLCHGQDWDGDGLTDVRVYWDDFQNASRDQLSTSPIDMQSLHQIYTDDELSGTSRPRVPVLSDAFFKSGLVMAIHKRHEEFDLFSTLFPVRNTFFAMASARVGVGGGLNGEATPFREGVRLFRPFHFDSGNQQPIFDFYPIDDLAMQFEGSAALAHVASQSGTTLHPGAAQLEDLNYDGRSDEQDITLNGVPSFYENDWGDIPLATQSPVMGYITDFKAHHVALSDMFTMSDLETELPEAWGFYHLENALGDEDGSSGHVYALHQDNSAYFIMRNLVIPNSQQHAHRIWKRRWDDPNPSAWQFNLNWESDGTLWTHPDGSLASNDDLLGLLFQH